MPILLHEQITKPKQDDLYFLETIVFEVEETLFQVPKHMFRHGSEIFETMLSLPQAPGGTAEGSEQHPVKLDGISRIDFKRLLRVLYPLSIENNYKSLKRDDWISILKLSTMWNFKGVRALAIEKITVAEPALDVVKKVTLGKQFYIPDWVSSGYQALVTRTLALTFQEGEELGHDSSFRLQQLREDYIRGYRPDVRAEVEKAFGQDLRTIRLGSEEYL